MDTYKQICAKLVDAWDDNSQDRDFGFVVEDAIKEARAALAEPEPEGPTDEELKKLLYFEFTQSTGHGHSEDPIGFARAVLARWGNYPASPDSSTPQPIPITERLPGPLVDSEVAELVEWLDDHAYALDEHGARIVRRAVDLLKQLPPRPISVTERLPGAEGCDGEEQFWWFFPRDNEWWLHPYPLASAYNTCTHWLPANAIPTPRSENDQ